MPASAGVDGVRQPGSMIPEPTTATVAPDADKEVQIDNASAQERKQPVQGHEDAIEYTEGDTVLDGLDGAGPTKSQAPGGTTSDAVEVQVNGEPENTAPTTAPVEHDESNDGTELAKQGNEKLPNTKQVIDLQDEGSKAAGDMTEEGKLEAAKASGETYEDGKARLEMNIEITRKKKANMETMPDCEEKTAMAKQIAIEEAEDNDLQTWLEENKPEAEKTAPTTAPITAPTLPAVAVDGRKAAGARGRGAAASGSNAGTEV